MKLSYKLFIVILLITILTSCSSEVQSENNNQNDASILKRVELDENQKNLLFSLGVNHSKASIMSIKNYLRMLNG